MQSPNFEFLEGCLRASSPNQHRGGGTVEGRVAEAEAEAEAEAQIKTHAGIGSLNAPAKPLEFLLSSGTEDYFLGTF